MRTRRGKARIVDRLRLHRFALLTSNLFGPKVDGLNQALSGTQVLWRRGSGSPIS